MVLALVRLFDFLDRQYAHHITSRIISSVLIIIFGVTIAAAFIVNTGITPIEPGSLEYFTAINASFTTLLIFEVLSLIFVLPQSVADSVGKQFEILSIILLRDAFKQFGKVSPTLIDDASLDLMQLLPMLVDALGALIIFAIIGFYFKLQQHARITKTTEDQQNFLRFKKIVALLLFFAFLIMILLETRSQLTLGSYNPSFNEFYTLLIFSDILILLYSMRYQTQYTNLFRYSSFAFATILIRMALSAPPYVNVVIGITAGVFVLGLTLVYNKFREES